jgi:hypothetical protein
MSDKIKEIKTRIDAGQGWPGWCPARSNLDHENECPLCLMYTNAPADIAWLLDQLTIQQVDNTTDVEEIYELRDEINALWDVVNDLAGNGGDDMDDVLKLYAKRVKVHTENRRSSLNNLKIKD